MTASNLVFVVRDLLENCDLVGDAEPLRADAGKNGTADFLRQRFRGENAGFFARKISYKLGGDVSRGVRDGRGEAALLANRVKRGKENVRTNHEVDVLFRAAFDAAHDDSGSEACIL